MADREEDSLYDDVSAMADRLKLTGSDKRRYIHEHMTRSGYKAVPTYVLAEDEDEEEEEESGFFGSGKRRPREHRDRQGGRSRRPRDDDDWYS